MDPELLEPGATLLVHNKALAVVGVLTDNTDASVNIMKVEKAPTETYADIGGLDEQIQEIKVFFIFILYLHRNQSNYHLLIQNCTIILVLSHQRE